MVDFLQEMQYVHLSLLRSIIYHSVLLRFFCWGLELTILPVIDMGDRLPSLSSSQVYFSEISFH